MAQGTGKPTARPLDAGPDAAATRTRREGESRNGLFRPPTRPQRFRLDLEAAPSGRIPAMGLPAKEPKKRSCPKPRTQQNKG